MKLADGHTRRRVIRSGAALLAGAVAGCTSNGAGTPTTTGESVFRGISFDGPDLVVELRADHGASRVNLVGPDGSAVAGADVAAGATTVRMPILRIQPGSAFEHYTPGVHELIAVLADGTESVELELRPDLRVTGIEQYRPGSQGAYDGRLSVTIENLGTGPTWVYEITYPEAPNWTLNPELGDDPGVTTLAEPQEDSELILEPGQRQTYVGEDSPLVFIEEDPPSCSRTVEFRVVIGTAVDDPLEQTIRVNLGGDVISAGLTDEYTCSEVTVEAIDEGTSG